MYRLLIVDDEPYIVSGLNFTFLDCTHLDIDIYLANSAEEAMDWLDKTRIDIILSDIRMPGMTGLELQEIVAKRWPECKMIFLTGYNEFEYVQTALRNNGADYLLKTEGEETIVQAVERVIRKIEQERELKSAVLDVRKQLKLALPVLQKQFLTELIKGETGFEPTGSRFEELQIGLSADLPVLAAIGRVDDWNGVASPFDKDLMLYAIQNIAHEFVSTGSRFTGVMLDRNRFVWLFQPPQTPDQPDSQEQHRTWSRFVQGTIATIQGTCKGLLRVTFSMACAVSAVPWTSLSVKYDELSRLLGSGLGNNFEMLLFQQDFSDKPNVKDKGDHLEARSLLNRLELINTYLDNGSNAEFRSLFQQLKDTAAAFSYPVFLEFYFSMVSSVISHLNRWSSLYQSAQLPDMERLIRIDSFGSRYEAISSLQQFCENLFAIRQAEQQDKTKEIALRINQYIEDHIDGDLSLTRLSEIVFLSPEYLSRLYKQITGTGISEQITSVRMAKARLLLKDTTLKIHEIARAVGYESAPTFTRFFKKANAVTPQEYRDRFVAN